jgi:hypothetical protein
MTPVIQRLEGRDKAITRMMRLATNGPKPVVIDEFPFLAKATPALPSLIQRTLEPSAQRRNTPVRLLRCGSALSFMGKLLAGSAPLRGRAGLEGILGNRRPPHRGADERHRGRDTRGGIAGYLETPWPHPRVWRRSQHAFRSNVVGPHFEEICRQWTRWHAGPETYGGTYPVRVASGTVSDPEARKTAQVDVAAFGRGDDDRDVLLVAKGEPGAQGARLLLFGGAGFSDTTQKPRSYFRAEHRRRTWSMGR